MSIGERIKKHRESKNITMKELGEEIGISESMISLYEANKNSPKIETIEKMAKFFNMPASELMFDEENENHQEFDQDALDILAMLGDNTDLKLLFKKTGKLSEADKAKVANVLRAMLPEDDDGMEGC